MTNSSLPHKRTEFAFDWRSPNESERLAAALQDAHAELEAGRMNARIYQALVMHLVAKLGSLRHSGPERMH